MRYGVDPNFTLVRAIKERDGSDLCFYCGDRPGWALDHVVARSLYGSDSIENLVLACHLCNSRKRAKPGWFFVLEHDRRYVYGCCQRPTRRLAA